MKNTAIIRTFCIAFVMMMLCGCNNGASDTDLADKLSGKAGSSLEKKEEKKTQKEKSKKKKNRKDKSKTENDDEWTTLGKDEEYLSAYEPVFTEVLDVLKNGYDHDREYRYVSDGLMERVMYPGDADLLNDTGYILKDINKDGVPELLIGYNERFTIDDEVERSYILNMFTIKDGEPYTVFEGWGRSRYWPLSDRQFYYSGSGGASNMIIGENHISEDGCEIVWDDCYFSEEDTEGNIHVYHNTTGVWDRDASERIDMSEYGFRDLMERYEKRCVLYTWTPFGKMM